MQLTYAHIFWGLFNLLLPCVLALFFLQWYKRDTSISYGSAQLQEEAAVNPLELVSSVWCRGETRQTRLCHFKNLCYNPQIDEYLFFHGPETVIAGLPSRENFSDYYIADLTSVEELNVHYLSVTDVPWDANVQMSVQLHPGVTLLAKRFKPDNLMHVIHDDLLPLFATLQEYCVGVDLACFQSIRLALLDGLEEHRFVELYQLLGNPHLLLSKELSKGTIHCFREALVGLKKDTTWYEYGYQAPQRPKERLASGQTIMHFTKHILGKLGLKHDSCNFPERPPYVVFMSRTRSRLILNELRVIQAVIEQTSLKLVKITDLGSNSIEETLRLVACAEMLIGMHGAALILAVFMRPGRALLEMFPYAVPSSEYTPYRTLANIPGVDLLYAVWENTFVENTHTHPESIPELGGLGHLAKWEQERIKSSKQVMKHLCCNDPEWLFRIYQDTIVDEDSFRQVLWKIRPKDGTLLKEWPDLYPGLVRNVSCDSRLEKEYLVSWQAPWNLQFLDLGEDAHYEMWIQQVGNDDVRSVITRNTCHTIPLPVAGTKYNCWIRCSVNNKVGNKQYVACH